MKHFAPWSRMRNMHNESEWWKIHVDVSNKNDVVLWRHDVSTEMTLPRWWSGWNMYGASILAGSDGSRLGGLICRGSRSAARWPRIYNQTRNAKHQNEKRVHRLVDSTCRLGARIADDILMVSWLACHRSECWCTPYLSKAVQNIGLPLEIVLCLYLKVIRL